MGSAPGPPSAVTLPVNEKTAVYSSTVKMTLCPEPSGASAPLNSACGSSPDSLA